MTLLLLLASVAAPDFALKTAQGREIKLNALTGQVVLVNFWATNCPPCVQEMPWLAAFQYKYAQRKFTVVGISLDEDWATVQAFLAKKPVPYPVVLGNDALADRYHVEAMPLTALVDRRGRIVWTHTGLIDRKQAQREIEKLLR